MAQPDLKAIRDAVPTSRHGSMLFDMVRDHLGGRAHVETAAGGAQRLLFARERPGSEVILPWPVAGHSAKGRLSVVFREAAERGQVGASPVPSAKAYLRGIERREAREVRSVDAWTAEEAGRLLEIAREREPRLYGVFLALFHTGMRRGEALGLRWEDVDWRRRELIVRRAVVLRRPGAPKSGKARRVPMSPDLEALLREKWGKVRRLDDAPRGWIFPSAAGTPIEPTTLRRAWGRVLARAAEGRRPVRALKLHCARHTWATLALEAGRSVRWVADVLGHADPSFTLRVYAHAVRRSDEGLDFVPGSVPSPGVTMTAPDRKERA